MEWLLLLMLLICPLMMIFCMKGMFSYKTMIIIHILQTI